MHPVPVLLYNHGVLSVRPSVQPAEGGQGGAPEEAGELDQTDCHGHELSTSA